MSSRYPPTHDSRYAPRARSRSPARYQEWRSPGPSNPGFANRHAEFGRGGTDPPRGPKTFNDPPRGPGPATGPAAPLGPRGRGAPPRPEFRELRDAPPLGTDRSFRDREYDRRARPASPRPRSPPRVFRDGPPARDLDIGRPRRESRDGPVSAGSPYSDQSSFGQPAFGRGGFGGRGRGRGRGDFEFRDRGRRGPIDDRPNFRPRDRSPPPRWGSISRPDREDWRPERRDEDRWMDRDDRDRDNDRFRKDTIPINRFESRLANDGPARTPTPHQVVMPSIPPPAERTVPLDQPKDEGMNRRFSSSTQPQTTKGREPLPPQADLMAGRAEASTAKYGSRTSSPPPSGPQVPAFGSFLTKASVYSGPTSNVWKAAADNRPSNPPARGATAAPPTPPAPAPVTKSIPTAPKAQLNAPPPAAPRAPRALEGGPPQFNEPAGERAPAAPKSWTSATSQPSIPTGPWAFRNDDRNTMQFTQPMGRDVRSLSSSYQSNIPSVPESPKITASAKVSDMGPSPSGSVQSQLTASEGGTRDIKSTRSEVGSIRTGTPPPTAPSGPRRTHSFSTSPIMHSPNIPTAPKAIRGPPVAPRAPADRGPSAANRPPDRGVIPPSRAPPNAPRAPAWNQWIRPGAPGYREPTVPAKRDANGEEKPGSSRSHTSPGHQPPRRVSEPSFVKVEMDHEEIRTRPSPAASDRRPEETRSTGLDNYDHKVKDSTLAQPVPLDKTIMQPLEDYSAASSEDDDDDDGMELDEEDFAQSKAKFERQKAHLESQLLKLEARQYRAVTPLEQIIQLACISTDDLGRNDDPSPSAAETSVGRTDEELEKGQVDSSALADGEDQQDLLTPKQEDLEDAIDLSDPLDSIMPAPIPPSVDAIQLPYLMKSPLTPLSERDVLQETISRHNASKEVVMAHLEVQAKEEQALEHELQNAYMEIYRQWQLDLQTLDHEKDEDDRQVSADPGPDMDPALSAMDVQSSETSRSRLHKFSSEYDIQKVLKESEETARLEQERLDRESKKIQADLEKEAVIPDVFDEPMRLRRLFRNQNRYRSPSQITEIFGYEPPRDTFTEEEHKKFLDLFKDRPKKWGEIARQLPGRSYADCIHHYYAFKWDGRFRETKGRRKGKGGRGRGSKAAPRTRGSALMADLSRTEEDGSNPPAFTETGRPRRAATRTTYGERDVDSKAPAATATTGKKGASTVESGAEKPAKRRKAAPTGERGGKRGRQPLAAAPTASPAPYEKESVPTNDEIAHAKILDEASLLTGLQAGRRGLQNDSIAMFAQENLSQTPVVNETGERPRQPGQPPLQRSNPSSYWSVPEQTDFIKFISHFGTDFAGIAAHMGTKTQTMVKNHYLRLIESGNKPELVEAARLANSRRENGENMGAPPTPTPITKRRYDNPPTLPRSLVSQTDFMDIDDPSAGSQPAMQLQGQAPQYPQPPRFITTSQSTPAPQPRVPSNPTQGISSPVPGKLTHPNQARSNPPPGPRMGFFSEPRLERRPTVSSLPPQPNRSVQQALHMHAQQQQEQSPQQARVPQEGSVPSPEFMENLEREKARAIHIQAQALHNERISQDRVPQVTSHSNAYHPMGLQHPRSISSGVQDGRPEMEDRPSTPGLPHAMASRQNQGRFRNVMGSPAPNESPITLNPSFRPGPMPSPPKREEYQPSSVSAPSPAQSVAHLAPPPQAEPRKTSNVMSLLNSEPEEPRPSKSRPSEHSNAALYSRAQSPAPQTLGAGTASSVFPPRREMYNQTPAPRSEYERPSYTQATSHVPTPPLQHERLGGGTMTPGGTRQEWITRPPTSQPPMSSSPHPPTPLTTEARPYFAHHRPSILGGLNSQVRHNPSPPPNAHPYLHHSRTPSLSHQSLASGQGPSHGMQQVQQAQASSAQSAPSHQPNPYSQPAGPASHMPPISAQQQAHLRHAHNASVGPGMQRRPMTHDEEYYMARDLDATYRRDEQIRQERRDIEQRQHLDRQAREAREHEAHYQAQHREQQNHYAAQYRQAAPPLHPSHAQSFSSQQPGLSLREQSAREADASLRDAMHREGQMRRDGYQQEAIDYEMMRRRQQEDRYEQMRDSSYPGSRLSGPYSHRR